MKKKENQTSPSVPQAPEQLVSQVRSYFTKEVNDQVAAMTMKEMESTMKDLINTRHWIALLKYTQARTPHLDSLLRTTNPTNDPHTISWAQGCLAGLCDIESYIIELNAPKAAKEEIEEGDLRDNSRPEGIIGNSD